MTDDQLNGSELRLAGQRARTPECDRARHHLTSGNQLELERAGGIATPARPYLRIKAKTPGSSPSVKWKIWSARTSCARWNRAAEFGKRRRAFARHRDTLNSG
jgi:hypothetical protein